LYAYWLKYVNALHNSSNHQELGVIENNCVVIYPFYVTLKEGISVQAPRSDEASTSFLSPFILTKFLFRVVSTIFMLIKCMIQFSARNSILRIYGWIWLSQSL